MIEARSPRPPPVASISPTQFATLTSCKCQAAFDRDPVFADLGHSSPSAVMGIAAHAVLEAAYRGAFATAEDPRGAALAFWDSTVAKLASERSVSQEPTRWRGYQMKRMRAASRAATVAASMQKGLPTDGKATSARIEAWLKSADGKVVGRPDRVETTGGRTTVVDLKTSSIEPDDVPAAYQQQLQLYSWLWHEVWGEWPHGAVIELLDGTRLPLTVIPAECETLAGEALVALDSFNELAESGADFTTLATPGIEQCRYCLFKGSCPAFLSAAEPEWGPYRSTIGGRLLEDSSNDDGDRCLTIAAERGTASNDGGVVRVRGILDGPLLPSDSFVVADRVIPEVALHDYRADPDSLIWIWDKGMEARLV